MYKRWKIIQATLMWVVLGTAGIMGRGWVPETQLKVVLIIATAAMVYSGFKRDGLYGKMTQICPQCNGCGTVKRNEEI